MGTGDTEYIVLGAQNDPDICTTSRSPASPRLCFSDCCSSPQKERKAKREPNWPQVPESYRIPEGLTSSNIIATMYPGVVGLAHSKHLSERVPYMAAVHPAGFITKSLVCLASKDISLTCSWQGTQKTCESLSTCYAVVLGGLECWGYATVTVCQLPNQVIPHSSQNRLKSQLPKKQMCDSPPSTPTTMMYWVSPKKLLDTLQYSTPAMENLNLILCFTRLFPKGRKKQSQSAKWVWLKIPFKQPLESCLIARRMIDQWMFKRFSEFSSGPKVPNFKKNKVRMIQFAQTPCSIG